MGLRPDGLPDRRHVTGASQAAVTKKVQQLEQQRAAGAVAAAGFKSPTVAQWLDHWLNNIAARTLRPRTAEGYRSKIDNHVVPALGPLKLEALQPEHLETLYRELADTKGLAPNSILQVHRIVSRALKVAVQRGRVSRKSRPSSTPRGQSAPRSNPSCPSRPRRSSPPLPITATGPAGQSRSPWGSGRAKHLGSPGRTSTSTTPRSPFARPCSA